MTARWIQRPATNNTHGHMKQDSTASETGSSDRRADPPTADSDGHPGWRVTLAVMWPAQLFCIMGFSFVMPFLPFYVRDLGVSERMVPVWSGLLITGAGLTQSIMGPVWGYVADRYGRKPMVQRAMFGGAVVLTLMGFVTSVHQLLALRVLQGAVTGTVPASIALISSVVPQARLGFSLGLIQMAVFSGGSIGPYLGGIVADHFGYRVPFGVTGALLFTGGILVLLGARERFVRPDPREQASSAPWRQILRARGLMMLLAVFFLMNLSSSLVAPIFPLFVEEIVGGAERAATETGLLLAITGIAAAFAAVMTGRLSDRLGYKNMLVAATAFAGLIGIPHAAAHTLWQLALLRLLFGLAAGGMIPAMNAMVAQIIPRDRLGQAYGFTTTASALGFATGPAIGGWAAAILGYRVPFVIMGVMLLALALVQRRGLQARGSEEQG